MPCVGSEGGVEDALGEESGCLIEVTTGRCEVVAVPGRLVSSDQPRELPAKVPPL